MGWGTISSSSDHKGPFGSKSIDGTVAHGSTDADVLLVVTRATLGLEWTLAAAEIAPGSSWVETAIWVEVGTSGSTTAVAEIDAGAAEAMLAPRRRAQSSEETRIIFFNGRNWKRGWR